MRPLLFSVSTPDAPGQRKYNLRNLVSPKGAKAHKHLAVNHLNANNETPGQVVFWSGAYLFGGGSTILFVGRVV
jgi:hypothetical protein